MLPRQEVIERVCGNPLPAGIGEKSDLIKGLYYYYGIGCREDEWLAEIFWQERIPGRSIPEEESGIRDVPAWRPECAFRAAMMHGPDTGGLRGSLSEELPRKMLQLGVQWLEQQGDKSLIRLDTPETDFRRAYCWSYLAGLPYYVWEGFDYRDPRPELILRQADEVYDTGSEEDWRENMEAAANGDCNGGSCFDLYTAAEKLYRLAAVGGNLRALETDVAEIEYYSEYEFEEEIWREIAGAVREAEKRADKLQAQGNFPAAARWWRKSAAGGNPSGMQGLIACLETWEEAPDRDWRLEYWGKRLSECGN